MGRLYEINHKYFEEINTENKAYLLGLLFADGCVQQPKGNRKMTLSITLQSEDRKVIDLLAKEICPNRIPKISFPPSIKNNGWKERISLTISSNIMCNDLINLGCKINKSLNGTDFPAISSKLKNHFIRGYFDGNGGITVNEIKNRYTRKTSYIIPNSFKVKLRKRAYFCSTDKVFLENIFLELPDLLGKIQKRFQRSCFTYSIEHQKDIISLQSYLYKNAIVFLNRKEKKFNMSISSQDLDTSK